MFPHRIRSSASWAALLWSLSGFLGCASNNPDVQVHRRPDGRLEVKGPLAGPYKKQEELAEGACQLMTSQPGASNGIYGFEYCAIHYQSAETGEYFLSYLSDVGGNLSGGRKYCELPTVLDDPAHTDAIILGGAHSHPNNREFSSKDMSARAHWHPTRFFNANTQHVLDRQLMMFFKEKTGECRAYLYNNTTRIVSALRGGKWAPIGKAYDDEGNFKLFDGMDWLP